MIGKYTPGPWQYQDSSNNEHILIYSNDLAKLPAMVTCHRSPNKMSAEEGRANARLIAAAPELLKAMEKAQTAYSLMAKFPNCSQQTKEEFAEIEKAIAKATGEA
jgi:hypothetical protein